MIETIPSKREFLAQVTPFRSLPAEELERLAAHARVMSYAKGESIYTEGETAGSVWIIQEGHVGIFKYNSAGKPFVIERLGPKELFGVLCRLGSHQRTYPCSAIAERSSTILQIPDKTFLDLHERYLGVVTGVCALCSERLYAVKDLACLEQERVRKRLAGTLLKLYKSDGIVIRFTKREIADLAGTSVETAIRLISVFAKNGWVASGRGKITIKEPDKLARLLASD